MPFRNYESGVYEIEGARMAGGRENVETFVQRELEELEWAYLLQQAKDREAFWVRHEAAKVARLSDPDITAVCYMPEGK